MAIKIDKAEGCNIIDRVEHSVIFGSNKGVVLNKLDYNDSQMISQVSNELNELKNRMNNNEIVLSAINEAIDAMNGKDESRKRNAMKTLGRELLNVGEGVAGSLLATVFWELGIPGFGVK